MNQAPFSLSVFWPDETLVETYPDRASLSARLVVLRGMSHDEQPDWEAADATGNVVEESP